MMSKHWFIQQEIQLYILHHIKFIDGNKRCHWGHINWFYCIDRLAHVRLLLLIPQ